MYFRGIFKDVRGLNMNKDLVHSDPNLMGKGLLGEVVYY